MRSLIDPTLLAQGLTQGANFGLNIQEKKRQEALDKQRRLEDQARADQNIQIEQIAKLDPETAIGNITQLRLGTPGLAEQLANTARARYNERVATEAKRAREAQQFEAGLNMQVKNPELATAYQEGLNAPSGPTYDKPEVGPQAPAGSLEQYQRPAGQEAGFARAGSLAMQLKQEADARALAEAEKDRASKLEAARIAQAPEWGKEQRQLDANAEAGIRDWAATQFDQLNPEERTPDNPKVQAIINQAALMRRQKIAPNSKKNQGSLSFSQRLALIQERAKTADVTGLIKLKAEMKSFGLSPEEEAAGNQIIGQRMSELQTSTSTKTQSLPDDPDQLKQIIRSNPGTPQAQAAFAKLKGMTP